MLMPKKPVQGIWGLIKSMLKLEGALNKQYDADLDGLVDNADKVDGYDAGTGANQVLVLDANGLVPLANIPVLNWTKLQFFGVRQEILAKFTNPKMVIATSTMLELLNASDKAGSNTGGITATTQELTIPGGTSTALGWTWIYFDLPDPATKIYVTAKLNCVTCVGAYINIMQSSGNVLYNTAGAYGYFTWVWVANTASDFGITKTVNGVLTRLAYEAVDLSYNTYYTIEIFSDINTVKAWRDSSTHLSVAGDTTNITEFNSVQIGVKDASTTSVQTGKVKGMVVVIYE